MAQTSTQTTTTSGADTTKSRCQTSSAGSQRIKKSRASRWRAISLVAVHLLFLIHILHWQLFSSSGETLTPVEPSEAAETIRTGLVNAGFIFFTVTLASTLLLGRLFCGWGCHIVALQDFCGYLMKRAGIRPKMFRTRTLVWVPFIAGFYMFLLPLFHSLFGEIGFVQNLLGPPQPFEGFRLEVSRAEFWETFPGLMVSISTLLVAGFAIVYFLGAKGFCNYGCPYGAFYGALDVASVGRIVADLDKCEQCGHCTASCTSNVQVHKEIQVYEKVVDRACMKCLDCVNVCPNGALKFGFSAPALLSRRRPGTQRIRKTYDVTPGEEVLLWLVGLAIFFAFYRSYGIFPFLFSLAIAGCGVFVFFKTYQLFRKPHVTFHRRVFRKQSQLTGAGRVFLGVALLFGLLTVHTGVIRIVGLVANRQTPETSYSFDELMAEDFRVTAAEVKAAQRARSTLSLLRPFWRGGWGLFDQQLLEDRLAYLSLYARDYHKAATYLEESTRESGYLPNLTLRLARVYVRKRLYQDALIVLKRSLERHPNSQAAMGELIQVHGQLGDAGGLSKFFREFITHNSNQIAARVIFANRVLQPLGQREEAERLFAEAKSLIDSGEATDLKNSGRQLYLEEYSQYLLQRGELERVLPLMKQLSLEYEPGGDAPIWLRTLLDSPERPDWIREVLSELELSRQTYRHALDHLLNQDKKATAEAVGRVALTIYPNDEMLFGRTVRLSLRAPAHYPPAKRAAEDFLSRNPESFRVRALYAEILLNLGDRKTALSQATLAARAAPDDVAVQRLFAAALILNGQVNRAIEVQTRVASKLNPDDPLDAHRLLEIYQNLGHRTQIQYWEAELKRRTERMRRPSGSDPR